MWQLKKAGVLLLHFVKKCLWDDPRFLTMNKHISFSQTYLKKKLYFVSENSPSIPLPPVPSPGDVMCLSPSGSLLIFGFNCPSQGRPFTGESLNKPDSRSQHWIIWLNELINISHLQAVARRTMSLDRPESKREFLEDVSLVQP